jgi:transcriptional regulator with XRE-family HTH domain
MPGILDPTLRSVNCKRILASCSDHATRSKTLGVVMDLKSHIGMRVKSARRRVGLTQEQLAEAVSKAVETISNIERGHSLTGLETLEKIARRVNTPLTFFFEGYRPERRTSRRRRELQQRLIDQVENLSEEQMGVAVRLIQALQAPRR